MWVRLAWIGALSSFGCEGIGRELVDGFPDGELESSCGPPAPCTPTDSHVEPLVGVPPSPASSFPCTDPNARSHLDTQSSGALSCLRWELPVEGELTLPSVQTTNVELVITAAQPARVTFEGARLSATRIELRGPVSLRFVAASALMDVQVIDATSATPSVSLVESEAHGFVLGGDEDEQPELPDPRRSASVYAEPDRRVPVLSSGSPAAEWSSTTAAATRVCARA